MLLTFQPPVFYSDESFYVAEVKKSDLVLETDILNLSDATIQIRPTEEVLQGIKNELAQTILLETRSWFAQKFTVDSFLKRFQYEFSNFSYDIMNRWVKIKWIPSALKIKSNSFVLIFKVESVTDCNPRIPMNFLESTTPRAQSPSDLEVQDINTIPLISTNENLALHIAEDISQSKDEEIYDRARLKAAIARMKVAKLEEQYIKKYGAKTVNSESELEEDSDSDSESKESSDLEHS